jgi:hypothetical protein
MYDLRVLCLSMVLQSCVRVGEGMNSPLLLRTGEWAVVKMMPKVMEFP